MKIKDDRKNLEWLVYWCLNQDEPCISFGRGRELLGFEKMEDMRHWYNNRFMENRKEDEN